MAESKDHRSASRREPHESSGEVAELEAAAAKAVVAEDAEPHSEPDVDGDDGEERFAPAEWAERAAWFQARGHRISANLLVGALHEVAATQRLTFRQVERLVEAHLSTPVGDLP